MMRYQLRMSTTSTTSDNVPASKATSRKYKNWWVSLATAQAYLLSAKRHVDDVVMSGIPKDNAISLHASWTSLIKSLVTTNKGELEKLIFTCGVHLEINKACRNTVRDPPKTAGPVAFPGSTDTDDISYIHEHLATLTIEVMSMRRPGSSAKGGRGRGRGILVGTLIRYKRMLRVLEDWPHSSRLSRLVKEQEEE